MLRVGIDGRAFSSPAGGVRRYVSNLVSELGALAGAVEMVALGGDRVPGGLPHVGEPAHPPSNAGWAIVGLPRAAAAARVDIIHAPAYTGPLWSRTPVVLTIHDVSYARHPEWYPYRRDWLRRQFYRRSAHAAARIITDSEFSAREIVAAYGLPREGISVVPLGVSRAFAPRDPAAGDGLAAAPTPAGDAEPFFLHVGDLHVRRNLEMVTRAVLVVRRRLGVAVKLVVAGVDRGVGEALDRIAGSQGAPGAVHRIGAVDDETLRTLYRDAVALVYPSRYEGFGLPVIEAMACGTPVIAADAGSIPEVAGDAGLLLDPDDEEGWRRAMADVLSDAALRKRLSASGLARAEAFTWARTARLTLEAYRAAAGGSAGR